MPDNATGVVEVDEDSERKAKKKAEREELLKQVTLAATQAAKDAWREEREDQESKQVDPKQRPSFEPVEEEGSRRTALPENLKGLLPSSTIGAMPEVRDQLAESITKDLSAESKTFNINYFPRDFDAKDFCMSRYCMAVDKWKYGLDGESAFNRYAPKEHQYYSALNRYGKEFKALGEYTSGQDGGFLAPRFRAAA